MTETLRSIFLKPVDRAIDGVIKADDEASLRVELDEYVITGEIGQRLEQFLEASPLQAARLHRVQRDLCWHQLRLQPVRYPQPLDLPIRG